ncbi:MAG: hypothetical protein IKE30_09560 [Clostridia bacterium]|nr:hypothetical protein [Clostridia bacterium]
MMYGNESYGMDVRRDGTHANREEASPRNPRMIRRFEHSGLQAGMFTFNAVLMVLMGAVMLMWNNSAANSIFNITRTPLGYWVSDRYTWMLCAFGLLAGSMFLMHASSLRKHTLTVTESGICGTTAGKFGMHPESFCLSWNQIQRVQRKHSSQLKVWGTDGSYTLCLDSHREAENLINSMLRKRSPRNDAR